MNDEQIVNPLNGTEILTLEERFILVGLLKAEIKLHQDTVKQFGLNTRFKSRIEEMKQFEIKLNNLLGKLI